MPLFPWSNSSCHHPSQVATERALIPGSEQDFGPCGLNFTCWQFNLLLQLEPKLS